MNKIVILVFALFFVSGCTQITNEPKEVDLKDGQVLVWSTDCNCWEAKYYQDFRPSGGIDTSVFSTDLVDDVGVDTNIPDTNFQTAGYDFGDYALLDGSNQPFTGNLNITKASPIFSLTQSSSNYSVFKKIVTNNEFTVSNGISYFDNPYAADIGGTDEYVINTDITKTSLTQNSNNFTISFWLYNIASGKGVLQVAPGLGSSSPFIYLKGGGSTQLQWLLNGSYKAYFTITPNSWEHLALRYDGTTWSWFINGTKYTSTAGLGTATGTAIYFGNGFHGYNTAYYDEVGIWTRALTDDEVLDLYNSDNGYYIQTGNNFPSTGTPIATNILAIWHFDEGTGLTVADTSGNGYTANFTNMETTDWAAGKVSSFENDEEITVFSSKNSSLPNERGVNTFGYSTGRTIVDGNPVVFEVGGSDKVVVESSGDLNVLENLFLDGNFFGNNIYGSNYFLDEAGEKTITISDSNVYYHVNGTTSCGLLNGVGCSDGNFLIQYDGVYEVSFNLSFASSGANQLYSIAIGVNDVIMSNCYSQRSIGTAASVGDVGRNNCLFDLSVGDNVALFVEDEASPAADVVVHSSHMGIKRVGN